MSEKIKIKVAFVNEPKQVGKFEVVTFKGMDGVLYETWSKKLAEVVKEDAEFEADVEHTEIEKDGNVYRHHKVTQIYKDGVGILKPSPSWGGKGSSDASIESQVAYKGVPELVETLTKHPDSKLAKAAESWALARLSRPPLSKSEPKEEAKPPQKTTEEQGEKSFKNVGELLTECMKHGIQRQEVLDFVGVKSSNEITKLDEVWLAIQKELIRENE